MSAKKGSFTMGVTAFPREPGAFGAAQAMPIPSSSLIPADPLLACCNQVEYERQGIH